MSSKLDKALSKLWAFGFQNRIINGVHSLTNKERNAIFFVSSHSGVIYDFENRTQTILQGHRNIIKCCVISKNKSFIVTCDSGDDPIIVIWDSRTGVPIKTIANAHPNGIQAVDISDDCLFIATLGTNMIGRQELAVWAWSRENEQKTDANQTADDSPILISEIPANTDQQHSVCFDPINKTSIATTGDETVIFWNWEEFNFEFYAAKVPKSEFSNLTGKFSSTVFLPGTKTAITATTDGFVVVWEPFHKRPDNADGADSVSMRSHMKSASKVLKLVECGISTMITTENRYLALACVDGAVRFYDFFLRLEAWFEDIAAGCVTSLSFALEECPYDPKDAGSPGLKFWVPNFVLGTTDALVVGIDSSIFDELNPEDRRGVLLLQGFPSEVSDVKCHPNRPLVAFSSYDQGSLQLWDYDMKLLMNLREFVSRDGSKLNNAKSHSKGNTHHDSRRNCLPHCIAFESSSGDILAVGFLNGDVKIMDVESLEDIVSFAPCTDAILFLKFSPSGSYLAGYDSKSHTILFRRIQEEGRKTTYIYIGRIHVHALPLAGIDFGYREGIEVLISVGEDRVVMEYDLENSSIEGGICCQYIEGADGEMKVRDRGDMQYVEVTARPTALMWHPKLNDDVEDKFIIVNDEFKFKEFNADSKQCRKITLAPTFASPPTTLLPIRVNGQVTHYAYSCGSRVIGIGSFPLLGDPSQVMGINAHPGMISAIAVSFDGKYLFSAGGTDLSAYMYEIDLGDSNVVSADDRNSESKLSMILTLLEGGPGGELHEDIIEYFYYCQLRAQGEESMSVRSISGHIPIEEVPSLMRAVGFYPSELQVVDMLNEVRYQNFMSTGLTQETINLSDFISLYVNHRPVLLLNNKAIADAFAIISQREDRNNAVPFLPLTWTGMRDILLNDGEAISTEDLESYLSALMGAEVKNIPENSLFDADTFSEHILGFV